MQTKRTVFPNKLLPYLLIAPQIFVTVVFFLWPAATAFWQSFLRQDAFGFKTNFVWFENYRRLFADPIYINAFGHTLVFAILVTVLSTAIALLLAAAAMRVLRNSRIYSTLLIWPYAVAPAIAGILWWFMFNPSIGIVAYMLRTMGINWNHLINPDHAMVLIVIAATWKQISYNFLFFLAALQSVPRSLQEAGAIDGAGPVKRFWTIVFPLISPTTFYLIVINIVYAMFDTFGIIHATTQGGPARATEILVYKVYFDGFIGLNLGSSAAQSVILMVIVIALTAVQFRFIERRVQY
ncbi:sn-glycerol-3-phosphate ABC transporter permease UgpA [Rhizobium laguerreae]|jgi:sn-glycerol 3-phosphate transport system permease protein|uniref:sn-glycerol-3-phosphate transport system permease protein UgpA n=1 Tax=Rhizobium laguerreae TaxID=1076926 RepID=A0A1S9GZV4_9HYPH|nr:MULTISPECIES: sn-glycerol-3-phosphate ABC transporter permease UgpA [Rhizobium]MBB3164134.1 sn-glycerol 3-phosphate transport system permease protein [Rhizobium laguerreae]MBY3073137.1 sn-glycerol-3-phosphate ABC transporter permease UgpA [Rhizobium laguerreae]MBY3087152.1 sn-glycerol-3-phosphate ABC transporter permease UgpA [Rhizobium laguerreae]MBY3092085.1 sn-glycerol-3-phosphate ABC transporter permease UgpA [Rhizobium laguerreae]MBY3099362.1 sn-glycerol-3-phosphate ABC transporter per